MDAFFKFLLIVLVVGSAQIASSKVTFENCPGNIYSQTGEASFTLPTAKTEPGASVIKSECDHSPEPTFYTGYVTKVVCSAEDTKGNKALCEFNVYLPDGGGCPKRQDDTNDKCVCSVFRPFFDPCECIGNYSGLNCEVVNAVNCTVSDPSPCDCRSDPCNCTEGFKGERCEIDFQAPTITCPEDIFTREASVQLPLNDSVTASDNDGNKPSVKCSPELGTSVNGTGNVTHTVTCSARDTAGNRADCSFRIVIDMLPPRIPYCPGIIHTNDSRHEWPVDIAVDNSHPKLNVTCEPMSGDLLEDYITNVTCYVQDMAGNAAATNCTFKIYQDGGNCNNSNPKCDCDDGCSCGSGFSGITCQVKDGSDCASFSEAGPGCVCDGVTGCLCRDGFKGANCDIDYQPPELSNCPFGEIWSKVPVVTYRPMWTRDNNDTDAPTTVTCYPEEGSEFIDYRTDVTCSAVDESGNKKSDCMFPVRRSSGSECESDGNNCYNCQSRCRCMPGYRGPKCQVCAGCANGGYRENPEDCQCQCLGLYHGLDCSDCYEPTADHCLNGGIFVVDTCSCVCKDDWTGRHCDQKPRDECLTTGAGCSCINDNCTCQTEYTGPNCDTCKPCQNDGNNQDSNTCFCMCPGFFKQPLCSECNTTAACQNGGTLDESACTCKCADGYKGKDCSEEMKFEDKCPSDIIQQPDAGKTTAKVAWEDPIETGATVECTPPSGSLFRDGSANVVCTATYADDKPSSLCVFKVFIDGRAPFVNCPADMDPYHQRWNDTAVISWASVTADDEVSGALTATCIPPSGTVFGSSTVICTASDQAGNLGFCTFDVTVYLRGSTIRFPTSMSCRKCYEDNPYGRCRYEEDNDEYECYCSSTGYREDTDGKCQDIDECEDIDECDSNAHCVNSIGGYRCLCNEGFYSSKGTCRAYPPVVYPDYPKPQANEPPFEKIMFIDVSIASSSMFGCNMTNDPMSSDCKILQMVFYENLREKYLEFSPALLRIDLGQSNTRKGNFGHTVVYDYSRLSASQKAASAQEFYEETIASSVKDGELGGLKLVKNCTDCAPPKDFTNLCGNNVVKPECENGYFLKEVKSADGASCYYACESLCATDYCSAGTCVHIPPFEATCSCPENTFGPNCEPITVTDKDDGGGGGGNKKDKLDLPLILGSSIGGGVLLVLILVIIGYVIYTKTNAIQSGKTKDEEFSMETTHPVEIKKQ